MVSKEECVNTLRGRRSELSRRFKVRSMSLFGSVARNEQTEKSDVDILVDMEPNLLRQVGLKQYLEEALGTSVDVIREHRGMDSYFLNQINHDRITIFS